MDSAVSIVASVGSKVSTRRRADFERFARIDHWRCFDGRRRRRFDRRRRLRAIDKVESGHELQKM